MTKPLTSPVALMVKSSAVIGIAGSSTISQFCTRHNFGRTTYFKLRKDGHGPTELRHGRLVRITAEAEREWMDRMQSLETVQ